MKFTACVLPILVLFLFTTGLWGQRPQHSLRFGVNFSQLSTSQDPLYPDDLSTYYYGYLRETRFLPFLRFGAGLDLIQIGSKNDDFAQVKLTYLSIPVSLRFTLGPLFVRGGYYGSVRIDIEEKQRGQTVQNSNFDFSRWDAGPFLGAGIKILVFYGEVRYSWGRVGVADRYSSRQFQVGGGLIF